MGILDVKCKESICTTDDSYYMNKEFTKLFLGYSHNHNYTIYLYFDLQIYQCLEKIKYAKIVLYKIPENNLDTANTGKQYSLYPLADFFSLYSFSYMTPKVIEDLKVDFQDKDNISYTEIDVTDIIKAWMIDGLENRGLLLMGNEESRTIQYASHMNSIKTMRPMLRICYEGQCICRPLSIMPCMVTVK